MDHISGETKISFGGAFMNFFSLNEKSTEEILKLEEGENLLFQSFGRIHKNLAIHLDSNIYVTNRRVAILRGNKLTTIWYEHVDSCESVPSNIPESIWLFGRFTSLKLRYTSRKGDKEIRYWCSDRIVGGAVSPDNDTTKNLIEVVQRFLPHKN